MEYLLLEKRTYVLRLLNSLTKLKRTAKHHLIPIAAKSTVYAIYTESCKKKDACLQCFGRWSRSFYSEGIMIGQLANHFANLGSNQDRKIHLPFIEKSAY